MTTLSANQEEFDLFKRYIEHHSSISLSDEKKYLLASRLTKLVVKSGCESFGDFYQIAPDNTARVHLSQLVHLSDFICDNQGYGRRRQVLPASFDESAWESLGLTLDAVPDIIDRVREEGERSEVFIKAFG